jgi:hypothetical protein
MAITEKSDLLTESRSRTHTSLYMLEFSLIVLHKG